jgi:hypothetical protein
MTRLFGAVQSSLTRRFARPHGVDPSRTFPRRHQRDRSRRRAKCACGTVPSGSTRRAGYVRNYRPGGAVFRSFAERIPSDCASPDRELYGPSGRSCCRYARKRGPGRVVTDRSTPGGRRRRSPDRGRSRAVRCNGAALRERLRSHCCRYRPSRAVGCSTRFRGLTARSKYQPSCSTTWSIQLVSARTSSGSTLGNMAMRNWLRPSLR